MHVFLMACHGKEVNSWKYKLEYGSCDQTTTWLIHDLAYAAGYTMQTSFTLKNKVSDNLKSPKIMWRDEILSYIYDPGMKEVSSLIMLIFPNLLVRPLNPNLGWQY